MLVLAFMNDIEEVESILPKLLSIISDTPAVEFLEVLQSSQVEMRQSQGLVVRRSSILLGSNT